MSGNESELIDLRSKSARSAVALSCGHLFLHGSNIAEQVNKIIGELASYGYAVVPMVPTEKMYNSALQSGFEGSYSNFCADWGTAVQESLNCDNSK